MERIKALEEGITIIDRAQSATSAGSPTVMEFLAAIRKYLDG